MTTDIIKSKPFKEHLELDDFEGCDFDESHKWPQKKCLDFMQENGQLLKGVWDAELHITLVDAEVDVALFKIGLIGSAKLYNQLPRRLVTDGPSPYPITRILHPNKPFTEEIRIGATIVRKDSEVTWIIETDKPDKLPMKLLKAAEEFMQLYETVQYTQKFEPLAKELLRMVAGLPAPLANLAVQYVGYLSDQEKNAAEQAENAAIEALVKMYAENEV